MIHEKLKFVVGFDKETDMWNVSVVVMGVELWLACFKNVESADRFINVFVTKIKEEAVFWTDYEILHN